MELEWALSFILTAAVLWYVLHPFFEAEGIVYERREEIAPDLAQEDLEEDYRMGKLSEQDYRELRNNGRS